MPETVMQKKRIKGLELPLLSIDERRVMLAALKQLTDFRMANISMDSGAYAQNFHAFLRGANGLGPKKQLAFLRNFGMAPDGTLTAVLHTWLIESGESWDCVSQAFQCEKNVVCQMDMQPVYLAPQKTQFVGLAVRLVVDDNLHRHDRRVLLTANDPTVTAEIALDCMRLVMGLDEAHVRVLEPVAVAASNARNLWRWTPSLGLPGASRTRIPPKTAQLPYDTDFLDNTAGKDTALGLLRESIERLEVVSADLCKLRGVRQSQWDASLIRRGWEFLEKSDVSSE